MKLFPILNTHIEFCSIFIFMLPTKEWKIEIGMSEEPEFERIHHVRTNEDRNAVDFGKVL